MTLDWKSLLSGRGRNDRTTFWTVQLLLVIAQACVRAMALLFPSEVMVGLFALFLVVSSVIGAFNLAKRLHDLGRSGWWMLVPFGGAILAVGFAAMEFGPGSQGALATESLVLLGLLVVVLAVGVLKGDPGPNRFGEPPGGKASVAA